MGEYADMAVDQAMAEYEERQDFGSCAPARPKYTPPKAAGAGPCPKCGKPTKRRNGPYGPFLGCTGFPACKGTRQLIDEDAPPPPQVVPKPLAPLTADERLVSILERLAKYHLKDGKRVLDRVNPELRAEVERYLPQ